MKIYLDHHDYYYCATADNPRMTGYGFTPFEAISSLFDGLAELANDIKLMGAESERKALIIWDLPTTPQDIDNE